MYRNLEKFGFILEAKTAKGELWACPQGKFWTWCDAITRPAQMAELGKLARWAASNINSGAVRVNLLEISDRGGARVSFAVRRDPRGDYWMGMREQSDPSEKRVQRWLPKASLYEIDGKWFAPKHNIIAKLDGAWDPVVGGATSASKVLAWLETANKAELEKILHEKQALAESAKVYKERMRLRQHNQHIQNMFNDLLIAEFGDAVEAFRKTDRGRAANIPLVWKCPTEAVKLALAQPGFHEYAERRKKKQAKLS